MSEARLRAGNQLTLPRRVVQAAGFAEGDRFLVEVTVDDPDTVCLRRIRSSYAGAIAGLHGDPAGHLDEERRSWE